MRQAVVVVRGWAVSQLRGRVVRAAMMAMVFLIDDADFDW
jgi:hypothetical protein